MPARLRLLLCCLAPALLVLASPAAATETGGASTPGATSLDRATCGAKVWTCGRGQKLTLHGESMHGVESVVFLGGEGTDDDRRSRPTAATDSELDLFVPRAARTGRLRLITVAGDRVLSEERLTVTAPARKSNPDDASPSDDGRFPIAGRHDMGQSETNSFGGGRGHQGQDLFAACGTPLVAVRDGTVQHVGRHANAGNYLVLQDAAGRSFAYMHLRSAPLVDRGDRVSEGQRVGHVGDTGRATGCHLHFEIWTAPGWYSGGRPVDPMPQLRRWHRTEPDHR